MKTQNENAEVRVISLDYMPSSNDFYVSLKDTDLKTIDIVCIDADSNALFSFLKAVEREREIRAGKRIRRCQKVMQAGF